MKRALITGITGQDGSYLTELLLYKKYEVHGIIRRASTFNTGRIDHLYEDKNLHLHYGDLSDASNLTNLLYDIKPHEIYHLGAQSHVRVSFDMPEYTGDITGLGTVRLLEALRRSGIDAKYYQASSSEMFGSSPPPQNENTPFQPRSPYGCAKVYSYNMAKNYREAYGLFICNGILFNHESPRRGETFVTRKIAKAVAEIIYDNKKKLYLGNLDAKRDWGHARDYVEAMWLMLQQDKPDDYVIATGETHSVREFVDKAFGLFLLDYKVYVRTDPKYFRPTEVDVLQGDASKAKKILKWKPHVNFDTLVKEMVMHEYNILHDKQDYYYE